MGHSANPVKPAGSSTSAALSGSSRSIVVVAAARPNFMKIGPIIRALEDRLRVELIHTGQHYDDRMYQAFFRDLGLPKPDFDLGVGSGSHAEQTAAVMVAFEQYLQEHRPDAVVVVGDVNSTLAASLAAAKLQVPVAHVEAGLRSGDWSMPEEINRVVTDRVSRWLFTPSQDANENLAAEGVPQEWVHLVGNVMIDTLLANIESARARGAIIRQRLGLAGPYGVCTLHRPSNVDDAVSFRRLMSGIGAIDPRVPLIFPVHPRTAKLLVDLGVSVPANVVMVEPMGYLDFIGLIDAAALVLTDSGGIQEETSVLGVPCLTLRRNTERPITCELGTNRLVGTDPDAVATAGREALCTRRAPREIPLWDGHAGARVANVLLADLALPEH